MEASVLQAWRTAAGLTQEQAAERLGINRVTLANYERGSKAIPEGFALPTPSIDTSKLTPWTIPAGLIPRDFGAMPITRPGWQRCGHRVVSDKIPDPIPYDAPAKHGWRAILTKSGRAYDYETGREMNLSRGKPVGPKPGSMQHLDKKYKRAAA